MRSQNNDTLEPIYFQSANKIRESLEKAMSSTSSSTSTHCLVDLLNEAQQIQVTAELLKRTKIGIMINKLKSHSNRQVSELASALVTHWKRQILALEEEKSNACSKKRPSEAAEAEGEPEIETKKQCTFPSTKDATRDKCIQMFYTALQVGLEERKSTMGEDYHQVYEMDHALGLAVSLESCLYQGHAGPQYKAQFRSKYLNLKEKSNPALRLALLDGSLSPSLFVAMSSAQMASEERRAADAAIIKDNLLKARAAKDSAPETDMFICGRCKQRKCKYFQMQTRSADEPMTTYVTCLACGHRWKM